MTSVNKKPVIIVGAGLSGLACAVTLHEMGVPFAIYEAADAVGGRIRTDKVDGFLLDRGFQVLLTAYPAAQRFLNYSDLKLSRFLPGARIWNGHKFLQVDDPLCNPLKLLPTLFSSVGTVMDKLILAKLVVDVTLCPETTIWERSESTILEAFKKHHFSSAFIQSFFSPFLKGITLDPDLQTSSRFFEFVMREFALGHAVLPQNGMQAIPQQLATQLPQENIHLHQAVEKVESHAIVTASGQYIEARAVVVACDGFGASLPATYHSVTNIYFSLDQCPVQDKVLLLNGSGQGMINNLCFPSLIHPNYAPSGKHLASVSILGLPTLQDDALLRLIQDELETWFGPEVRSWQALKIYRIAHALPKNPAGSHLKPPQKPIIENGIIYCGDVVNTPSIQGALSSGQLAAQAVQESV